MKKILLIAPSCYPVYDAESIVNIKMLKALNLNEDIEIDLVSKINKYENYPSNSLEDLGVKLNSCHLVEVDNKINLTTIFQHVCSYFKFGVVFKGSHWAYKALPIVEQLVKVNHYDYVLTKSGSSPLLGYYLKKHRGLKWLFTCNDPYPNFTYPKIYADFYHAKSDYFSRKVLRLLKRYVDVFIFPSSRLQDHMKSYIGFDERKCVVIPHAVNLPNNKTRESSNSNTLKIIHSGNLRYPRDPEVFLRGLRKFIDDNDNPRVQFTILGVADDSLKTLINQYNLQEYVNFMKSVEYMKSLELLSSFDVALIIEAKCPIGIFLPTKVSDFMQCGKPIFAVSPKIGVLNDLYNNGNIPYFADNENSEDVAKTLQMLYEDFKNHSVKKNNIPIEYLEQTIANTYYNI